MNLLSMNRVSLHADQLAEALQLIALPACACDAGGTIVAANAALLLLLGRELRGEPLAGLAGEDWRAGGQLLQTALASGSGGQRWDGRLQGRTGRSPYSCGPNPGSMRACRPG